MSADWRPTDCAWGRASRGVEAALLLATLRRLSRPSELPPLPKIRSLAYFMPVIADRKSTRLNSSHLGISYAVFCLKKKKIAVAFNEHRRTSHLADATHSLACLA